MRILVVGATGTIGVAVAELLGQRHEIVAVSRSRAAITVDVTQPASLRAMFERVGRVDAIVSLSGGARFAPLEKLTDADFEFSLANKLMGQVNLARHGLPFVRDGGSITLTSGVLAWKPMPGSAAISLVNGALEGFGVAAALEAPRGIRVNVVSPPWVTQTLQALKWDVAGGRSAADVATLYARSVEGRDNGQVIAFE
jgi:NAD(P)-dependent dehydrogenase (short-subunit alcohol dehydrogenase family)